MAEDKKTTTAVTATDKVAPKAKAAKKNKRIVNAGQVHIQATFNNTIVTITETNGAIIDTIPPITIALPTSIVVLPTKFLYSLVILWYTLGIMGSLDTTISTPYKITNTPSIISNTL